jgi:hypothetical protein
MGEVKMTEAKKQLTKQDWLNIAIMLAFIGAVVFMVWALANGEESLDTARFSARSHAQTFVKRHLKAPATAEFPWGTDEYSIVSLGDGRWKVSSYVDAQNGFGAMVRSRWDVTLRRKEDGSARLEDINIH